MLFNNHPYRYLLHDHNEILIFSKFLQVFKLNSDNEFGQIVEMI